MKQLIYIFFVCVILIIILAITTTFINKKYNLLYENYTTSFLGNTSNLFPQRNEVLSGSLPTQDYVLNEVQAIDNDLLAYENN